MDQMERIERKLEMRDTKNPNRKFPDQDSVDKFLELARQDRKSEMFFYRKRVGYNSYVIQLFANHPSNEKEKAEVLYEISGASRSDLAKMKEFPKGKPVKAVIKDGRPVKGDDLKPIDTKPDPRPNEK